MEHSKGVLVLIKYEFLHSKYIFKRTRGQLWGMLEYLRIFPSEGFP